MRKELLFFLSTFYFVAVNQLFAQQNVSISDVNATPDASSVLDVSSTTKGMLIPRVALTATNVAAPITLPQTSLLVYNTATTVTPPFNVTPGYYYNAGTPTVPNWLRFYAGPAAGTEWKLLGNSGTDANTNFLGTIDAVDLVFRTSNLQRARINSIGNMGVGVAPMGAAGQAILSVSRDGVNACCGGENSTLALGEATNITARRPSISFHASGESEGVIYITEESTGIGNSGFTNRRIKFFDNQSQGLGIETTGNLWYGTSNSRTQWRNNAGLQGNAGAQSGFYEFLQLSGNSQDYNYPSGYSGETWWHLLDIRHNNPGNNFTMQFSGNFFDQRLFFRKTDNNASKAWSEIQQTATLNLKSGANGTFTTGQQTITTTNTIDVKSGERYMVTVIADLRNNGGSGNDRWRLFVSRNNVSGCSSADLNNPQITSTPFNNHNDWHTYTHNWFWIADCNGQLSFSVRVERFDSDDAWWHGDCRVIITRL